MTEMQKSKVNKQTPRKTRGFSTIELLITATILTIVTGFGFMGITRAKASIRLSGAAREYASYIEKARIHSIRSHADEEAERAGVAVNEDKLSYNVTMDLDGDGDLDTRTIPLPTGVEFDDVETIAFDWRGRTWNTVGGMTLPNAQVSIRMHNDYGRASIDVTGSGDITIDSSVFDDELPQINLHVGDLAAGATPVPTPDTSATPESTPDPEPTPDTGGLPAPTPTPPDLDDVVPVPTPTPKTGGGVGNPNATPTPTPTPTATPTPVVCNLTTNLPSLTLGLEGTATIRVGHDSLTSLSISGNSSKSSELQVTPGGSQTVSAGGSATFTIKSKKTIGVYSVTFSSNCGSKTVGVVVVSLGLGL